MKAAPPRRDASKIGSHLKSLLLTGCFAAATLSTTSAEPLSSKATPPVTDSRGLPTSIVNEKRVLPVVIRAGSSSEVQALAKLLVDGLHKMTGRDVHTVTESHEGGIVIGTAEEFPDIFPKGDEARVSSQKREDYLLRSDGKNLYILGRTERALKSALWDFLYRLGYRQFFPGPRWEIWPSLSTISVSLDAFESPQFYNRTLAAAGMNWPEAMATFNDWKTKNRMESSFQLHTTHVYGAIIRKYPDHFQENPADIVPNSNPEAIKLDPSRESVRKIAAQFALDRKREKPELDSISMDPSDGGGWRLDSPLGSASNQTVSLANYVAEALQGPYPETKVGILAYHEHSLPPTIAPHPHVIVSVAAGFIKGGYTFEELLQKWGAWGNETGVYEYLSVSLWDFCQPGRSRASNLDYIRTSIPNYHKWGARYYRSEISNSWAPHGLGLYLTSRLLWNPGDSVDDLLKDFYSRSFGAAAPVMKRFYQRYLLAEGGPMMGRDLVGRMYRTLDEALKSDITNAEKARIIDILEYTRFLDLTMDCYEASDEEFGERYKELCIYLWRTRASGMVNGGNFFWKSNNPEYSSQTLLGRRVERPARWSDPKHPWKTGEPITEAEFLEILAAGIDRNPISEIEPISYSTELVPYPEEYPWRRPAEKYVLWRNSRFYVDVPSESRKVEFTVAPRSTAHGPVRLSLFSKDHPFVGEPIATAEIPADGKEHQITLISPYSGVHEVEYTDGGGKAALSWPKGQRVTFPIHATFNVTPANGCDQVFYVPQGLTHLALFVEKPTGSIASFDGTKILDLKDVAAPGLVEVPVPPGESGKVWVMKFSTGRRTLLNAPPYIARHPSELMIPKEALDQAP